MNLTAGSGSRWLQAPRSRSSEPHTFGASQIRSPPFPMNLQREIERSENSYRYFLYAAFVKSRNTSSAIPGDRAPYVEPYDVAP